MKLMVGLRQLVRPSFRVPKTARRVFSSQCALAAEGRLPTSSGSVAATMEQGTKHDSTQNLVGEDADYAVSK